LACLAYFVTGQDPGQQIADYVILICSNGRRWGWLNDFEENKPVSPGMPELLAHFLLPFGTPAMLEQIDSNFCNILSCALLAMRAWSFVVHPSVSAKAASEENKPVSPGMPELLAHFLLPFGTPAMLEQLEGMGRSAASWLALHILSPDKTRDNR
jgi:ABC-type arginine transport system permease subunit